MLRRDFISKYIEELGKMLTKLLDLEQYKEEIAQFDFYFDEMLHTYYKLDSDRLSTLLEADEERDLFLLSFDMKNKNTLAFVRAAKYFSAKGEMEKVATIKQIVQRIQAVQSDMFRFPSEEDLLVQTELKELNSL